MGVWLMNRNSVKLKPEIDDSFILRFDSFCRSHYPYEENDGLFCPCTWYFNESNELSSYSAKYGEVSAWYDLLVNEFFTPLGYSVIGDPEIVQEFEFENYVDTHNSRIDEKIKWEYRLIRLRKQEYDRNYQESKKQKTLSHFSYDIVNQIGC